MDDLIKLVLECLKCENSRITYVSLNFLEIVQLFEPKWSENIKRKKFKIYNRDFIKFLKTIQSKLSSLEMKMKHNIMRNGELDDEVEEEEEQEEYEEEDDENFYYHK